MKVDVHNIPIGMLWSQVSDKVRGGLPVENLNDALSISHGEGSACDNRKLRHRNGDELRLRDDIGCWICMAVNLVAPN